MAKTWWEIRGFTRWYALFFSQYDHHLCEFCFVFDIHIGKQIEEIMQQSFQSAQTILETIGQPANEQFEKRMKQTMDVVIDLLPTAFVFAAACFAWITQQAALPILKRLNMPIGNWQPFRELVLPKSLLWYYLAAMLLLFFRSGTAHFFMLRSSIYFKFYSCL